MSFHNKYCLINIPFSNNMYLNHKFLKKTKLTGRYRGSNPGPLAP